MKLENKKRYIISLIVALLIVISLGTYAWLTYRTNDTAMVLTIGDINNVRITMNPYQVDAKLSPNLTYTGQEYTTVEVVNNSSSPRNIKLFYTINFIDSELANSNLKYTIEKKAVGSSSYTHITPDGNFSGASNGSIINIIDEPAAVGTTYYKVYVWLYSASSGQNNVPGKKFNAELNATIGDNQYTVTLDANNGTVSPEYIVVNAGGTYQNLPTPTRTGYTFLGWNGKNLFNKDATPYKANYYLRGADNVEVSLDEYSIYQVDVKPNTAYTITNSGQSTAPGYVIYNSSGTKVAGANYANTATITFTTPGTASYIRFSVVTKTSSSRYDKETFQLEESNVATTYEPYYITNGTSVVQNQNHTLTAIWQRNT